MNDLHQSSSPARSIGEDLLVEFLAPRHSVSPEIAIFQENLVSMLLLKLTSFYLVTVDNDIANLVQQLKNGLLSPAILATYSPGNNIGNIHWLWLTDATVIFSAVQSCHQVIESIKVNIPTYHTRAMRKVMYDKFGLVSRNMNKAVLRHFY